MKIIEITHNKSCYGTAFYGSTFKATVNEIKKLFGKEDYIGDEYCKSQHDWCLEGKMDGGNSYEFSIYDWKEYREYGDDEIIDWHIGGSNHERTDAFRVKIEEMLEEIR